MLWTKEAEERPVGAPTRRSLGFCFTQHNWTESQWLGLEEAMKRDSRFAIMGAEVCPTTQTPHIQGYVAFPEGKAKTFTAFKAWFESAAGAILCKAFMARGSDIQNDAYCSKQHARLFTHGEPLATPADKGAMARDLAKRTMECMVENRYEDIDPRMWSSVKNFEHVADKIKRARRVDPVEIDGVLDNTWIVGARGSGKDRMVRKATKGRFYPKSMEVYWNDYDDEEDVYIEDVDKESVRGMARHLKIWSDRYPFVGRRMYGHGQCLIRPKRIWITSQYHPKDLFNKEDAEAITRRFRIVHMDNGVGVAEPRQWTAPILDPVIVDAPPYTPDPPSPDRFGLYLLD